MKFKGDLDIKPNYKMTDPAIDLDKIQVTYDWGTNHVHVSIHVDGKMEGKAYSTKEQFSFVNTDGKTKGPDDILKKLSKDPIWGQFK